MGYFSEIYETFGLLTFTIKNVEHEKLNCCLKVADVEVVVVDNHVRGLSNVIGATHRFNDVSGVRVDDKDGRPDRVDDGDFAVVSRREAGNDVDVAQGDAADKVTALVENLEKVCF